MAGTAENGKLATMLNKNGQQSYFASAQAPTLITPSKLSNASTTTMAATHHRLKRSARFQRGNNSACTSNYPSPNQKKASKHSGRLVDHL